METHEAADLIRRLVHTALTADYMATACACYQPGPWHFGSVRGLLRVAAEHLAMFLQAMDGKPANVGDLEDALTATAEMLVQEHQGLPRRHWARLREGSA